MNDINQITYWWSIISTIIGIILLGITIWSVAVNKKEKERKIAQVKIWQHYANGISLGLKRIVYDANTSRYTDLKDITSAVWSVEASAFSLYFSLYEERTIPEDEYKQEQKIMRENINKKDQFTSSNSDIDKKI